MGRHSLRSSAKLAAFAFAALSARAGFGQFNGLRVETESGLTYVSNTVLVRLKPQGWLRTEVNKLEARYKAFHNALLLLRSSMARILDIEVSTRIGDGSIVLIRSASKSVKYMISKLGRQVATPDYVWHIPKGEQIVPTLLEPRHGLGIQGFPNDAAYPSQWGMQNTGQTVGGQVGVSQMDVEASPAWTGLSGTSGCAVGLIDSGVDYTHPDFQRPDSSSNIWSAPYDFTVTIGGQTITCPAGAHGISSLNSGVITFDPIDGNGHGTHCAGTIGAVGNNSIGIAGLNWRTTIVPCRFLDASGSGDTVDAINCLEFLTQLRKLRILDVRVASNSWGGGPNDPNLAKAFSDAYQGGILCIASAGNDTADLDAHPSYPASYPSVFAVAAYTNQGNLAGFSDFGRHTARIVAPGENIFSTIPVNRGSYGSDSGTSMAAPFVAGAAMMALTANPYLNASQLGDLLIQSNDPDPRYSGLVLSGGRLDCYKAVEMAKRALAARQP